MFRKTMATVLTLVMLLTLFPLAATASEGELTLKSYNATTSVITVDLEGVTDTYSIDETSLLWKIQLFELTESGSVAELFDFTASTAGGDYAEGNTIVITPTQGIQAGKLYQIILRSGISDTATTPAVLTEDITIGWFYVTVIYSDDFNVTFDGEGNPEYPYYIDAGVMKSYNWNMRYSEFTGIYDGQIDPDEHTKMTFANNAQWASLNTTGLPAVNYAADYTVEYKYGLYKNSHSTMHRLGMRAASVTPVGHSNGYWYAYGSTSSYGFGFLDDISYTGLTGTAFLRFNNANIADSFVYNFNSTNVSVRASAIGDKLQYFIDNDKLFDITDTQRLLAGTINITDGCDRTVEPHATVDDLIISKYTDIGEELPMITLSSYNADISSITVELAGVMSGFVIDELTLNNKVNLFKNGVQMDASDYTVTLSGNEILIKPVEGMIVGMPYEVKLGSGITDTSGITFPSVASTTEVFEVTVIFSDDFETSTTADYRSNPSNFTIDGGKLNFTGEVGRFSAQTSVFPENQYVADYTTEADIVFGHTASFIMYVRASNNYRNYNEWYKYNVLITGAGTVALDRYSTASSYTGTRLFTTDIGALNLSKTYNLKVIAKGNNIKVYLDDIKIIEYYDTDEMALTDAGTFGIHSNSGTGRTIDNLTLTKVEPSRVKKLELEGMTIDDFDSASPIAQVTVKNYEDIITDFTLIVALFDVEGNLINVNLSEKTLLGQETYTVNLINNGVVDSAKAYLWGNLTNLRPLTDGLTVKKK